MNVLIVQRQSLVANVQFSLSVYARVVEAMDWLQDQGNLQYVCCGEREPNIYKMLSWADVAIFCKHSSKHAQEINNYAKRNGCRTILDLDDWIFDFPSYSGASNKKTNTAREMLDAVDAVTVSNIALRDSLIGMRPDTLLVPNGIYLEKYPQSEGLEAVPPRLVFTNADFLKIRSFKKDFIRLLQDFSRKYNGYLVDFYGDVFPELMSLPFLHYTQRIPYDDYLQCLARGRYTFAIIPLGGEEDGESSYFNARKNPFKFLNYGAARIPGVYSDVPIYRSCITNGVTGLLVPNTYGCWMEAIEALAGDAVLRASMREAAYQAVARDHHIRHGATLLWSLLIQLVPEAGVRGGILGEGQNAARTNGGPRN